MSVEMSIQKFMHKSIRKCIVPDCSCANCSSINCRISALLEVSSTTYHYSKSPAQPIAAPIANSHPRTDMPYRHVH